MDGGVAGARSGAGLGLSHWGGQGAVMGELGGKGEGSSSTPGERVPGSSMDLQGGERLGGSGGERKREKGGARLTHMYTE